MPCRGTPVSQRERAPGKNANTRTGRPGAPTWCRRYSTPRWWQPVKVARRQIGVIARAAAVLSLAITVTACTHQTQQVRVVNDTAVTWSVCGSDCRANDALVDPGQSVVVQTQDGEELFLEQHGRQTGECLFPGRSGSELTIHISARRECVR